MPTPHKNSVFIKAWADGHTIQVKTPSGWIDVSISNPRWDSEYRIKPEPQTIECFVDIEYGHIITHNPQNTRYKKATLTIHPDD